MLGELLLACTQVSAAAEVLYAFSFMKFGLFIVRKNKCNFILFLPTADSLSPLSLSLSLAHTLGTLHHTEL